MSNLMFQRRYAPLFATQFLGALNDNLFKNAYVVLITYYLAEQAGLNAGMMVTLAAGMFILPFFLFSATAGQYADKLEKSRLITRIKMLEIVLMAFGGLGFAMESSGFLMLVLFGMGTQSAFFGPLKYSILPDHLQEHELIAGNAWMSAGTFLAILLGTILGGLLILQPDGTTLVTSISLCVAVLGWLSSRWIPVAAPAAPNLHVNRQILRATWHTLQETKTREDVFLSILGISWFWFVGATFLAQFPTFAKHILNSDEQVVTLFLTLFSVGIAMGSMLCNRMLKGKTSGSLAPWGALGMALGIGGLYVFSPEPVMYIQAPEILDLQGFLASPGAWGIVGSLLCIAICGGVYIVPLYAIMQARTAKSHRARVVAGNNIMNALFMVASALVTLGMYAAGMTVTDVFAVLGLVNVPVAWLVHRIVKAQQALQAAQQTELGNKP